MSRHSPHRKWTQRLTVACKNRDADALERLERERLANPQGMDLLHGGVLGQGCARMNPWVVGQALAWDLPRPDFEEVFYRYLSASPTYNPASGYVCHDYEDFAARADAVWDLLVPHAPPEAIVDAWAYVLSHQPHNPVPHHDVARFVAAGVDPSALVETQGRHTTILDPAITVGLGRSDRARWSPMLATLASNRPDRMLELLDAGVDPWQPVRGDAVAGWTLGAALGLDPGRPLDTPDNPLVASPGEGWESVRARVLACRMGHGLPTPCSATRPRLPRL